MTALTAVAMIGYVGAVYLVVVIGGGVLLGRTSSPGLGRSVAATAFVALSFERVERYVRAWSWAALRRGQRPPYDALHAFAQQVGAASAAPDAPIQIARIVREGTGAQSVQLWLAVDGRRVLAAMWPPDAGHEGESGPLTGPVPGSVSEPVSVDHELAVRHAGDVLGYVVVRERSGVPLNTREETLLRDLVDQVAIVLRGLRLRAALRSRHDELTARACDLRESRTRVFDAQDAERRRLERDIHDGAQQHLVALTVNLRLALATAQRSPGKAADLLGGQVAAAQDACDVLADLAKGIFPTVLASEGLVVALRTATATSPVPVIVAGDGPAPEDLELAATAYFCCLEAVQNAVKHSAAQQIRVSVRDEPGWLTCAVMDDGTGFDPARTRAGLGLVNLRDRAESIGGQLSIESGPTGTVVVVRLPVGDR